MWLNPLPAETVLGAIVGAVLSTILAHNGVFQVDSLAKLRPAILFVFAVVSYGVCIHFCCAAMARKRFDVTLSSFVLALIIIFAVSFLGVREFNLGEDGRLLLLPSLPNVLLAAVLAIWFAALAALTYTKGLLER